MISIPVDEGQSFVDTLSRYDQKILDYQYLMSWPVTTRPWSICNEEEKSRYGAGTSFGERLVVRLAAGRVRVPLRDDRGLGVLVEHGRRLVQAVTGVVAQQGRVDLEQYIRLEVDQEHVLADSLDGGPRNLAELLLLPVHVRADPCSNARSDRGTREDLVQLALAEDGSQDGSRGRSDRGSFLGLVPARGAFLVHLPVVRAPGEQRQQERDGQDADRATVRAVHPVFLRCPARGSVSVPRRQGSKGRVQPALGGDLVEREEHQQDPRARENLPQQGFVAASEFVPREDQGQERPAGESAEVIEVVDVDAGKKTKDDCVDNDAHRQTLHALAQQAAAPETVHQEQPHQPPDRSGRADRVDVSRQLAHQASRYAANEVNHPEARSAIDPLDHRSHVEQQERIEEEVQQAAVEEDRRDQTPPLAPDHDPGRHLGRLAESRTELDDQLSAEPAEDRTATRTTARLDLGQDHHQEPESVDQHEQGRRRGDAGQQVRQRASHARRTDAGEAPVALGALAGAARNQRAAGRAHLVPAPGRSPHDLGLHAGLAQSAASLVPLPLEPGSVETDRVHGTAEPLDGAVQQTQVVRFVHGRVLASFVVRRVRAVARAESCQSSLDPGRFKAAGTVAKGRKPQNWTTVGRGPARGDRSGEVVRRSPGRRFPPDRAVRRSTPWDAVCAKARPGGRRTRRCRRRRSPRSGRWRRPGAGEHGSPEGERGTGGHPRPVQASRASRRT